MLSKHWKSRASLLMTLALLEPISLAAFAQTPSTQLPTQCTEMEIQKHIQQLSNGEPTTFNALVACQSKAVPALIKALDTKYDENFRIIIIAALGQIGSKATPAVPFLKNALNDTSRDVRLISIHALARIDPSVKVEIQEVLKDTPIQARDTSKKCPSPGLDLRISARDCKLKIAQSTGTQVSAAPEIREGIDNSLNAKQPVMCRISAIRAVLKWKCP